MDPATIAARLRELALYHGLEGDRHRERAYERAARSIEAAKALDRLIVEGRLEELPGIGPAIARVVDALARTGTLSSLEHLRRAWPPIVVELAALPGVSVTRARAIQQALLPASLEAVADAARAGCLRALPGLGKITEAKILRAIEERREAGPETALVLVKAMEVAESIASHLGRGAAVEEVLVAGPVRRWCEVVDHLAFAVATSADADVVFDHLLEHPLIMAVDRSARPAVLRLAGGPVIVLHVAPRSRFGWACVEATGSPAHVARLGGPIDGPDETAVYAARGRALVPPEVRDGTDELDGDGDRDRDAFADLVTLADVTAAVHCHTTYSDGKASIAEMAAAAGERGFRAITITDHSAAAGYAGGLDLARLREQRAAIDALRDRDEAPAGVRILHGTEADILADGAIDVPPEMIGELDVVIASVHQRFKLDEDGMTRRVVAAMRAPFMKVWGHALGRIVLQRDPIAVRLDEILDAIAESRAAIELNGDPYRLDLDPVNARKARSRGLRFVLSSDAHSTRGLDAIRFAVAMARRARITRREVLNTLPPDELADALRPL